MAWTNAGLCSFLAAFASSPTGTGAAPRAPGRAVATIGANLNLASNLPGIGKPRVLTFSGCQCGADEHAGICGSSSNPVQFVLQDKQLNDEPFYRSVSDKYTLRYGATLAGKHEGWVLGTDADPKCVCQAGSGCQKASDPDFLWCYTAEGSDCRDTVKGIGGSWSKYACEGTIDAYLLAVDLFSTTKQWQESCANTWHSSTLAAQAYSPLKCSSQPEMFAAFTFVQGVCCHQLGLNCPGGTLFPTTCRHTRCMAAVQQVGIACLPWLDTHPSGGFLDLYLTQLTDLMTTCALYNTNSTPTATTYMMQEREQSVSTDVCGSEVVNGDYTDPSLWQVGLALEAPHAMRLRLTFATLWLPKTIVGCSGGPCYDQLHVHNGATADDAELTPAAVPGVSPAGWIGTPAKLDATHTITGSTKSLYLRITSDTHTAGLPLEFSAKVSCVCKAGGCGNGVCMPNGECACNKGYTGYICELNVCEQMECGPWGDGCRDRAPQKRNGRQLIDPQGPCGPWGMCNLGECYCTANYTGHHCEIAPDSGPRGFPSDFTCIDGYTSSHEKLPASCKDSAAGYTNDDGDQSPCADLSALCQGNVNSVAIQSVCCKTCSKQTGIVGLACDIPPDLFRVNGAQNETCNGVYREALDEYNGRTLYENTEAKDHVVRWAGDGWEMAFLNRSSCADTTGWTDTNGRSCKDYANGGLCCGEDEPHCNRQFARHGLDSTDACCDTCARALNCQGKDCGEHGICTASGECRCDENYEGESCQTKIACVDKAGTCSDYASVDASTCKCNGYSRVPLGSGQEIGGSCKEWPSGGTGVWCYTDDAACPDSIGIGKLVTSSCACADIGDGYEDFFGCRTECCPGGHGVAEGSTDAVCGQQDCANPGPLSECEGTWSKENCAKTCGLCGDDPLPPAGESSWEGPEPEPEPEPEIEGPPDAVEYYYNPLDTLRPPQTGWRKDGVGGSCRSFKTCHKDTASGGPVVTYVSSEIEQY